MSDYLAAFTLGLLGLPHCLAMCGGIGTALMSRTPPPISQAPQPQAMEPQIIARQGSQNLMMRASNEVAGKTLLFGGGKMLAYIMIGTVAGLAGLLLGSMGSAWALFLRLFAAGLLFAMGLYALGLWRGPRQWENGALQLWQPLLGQLRKLDLQHNSHRLLAGVAWGLIPCGMVYSAMGLAAASGGPVQGGLVMFSFGLGTLPFVLIMAGLSTALTPLIQHRYWKPGAGILLMALAAWTAMTALA